MSQVSAVVGAVPNPGGPFRAGPYRGPMSDSHLFKSTLPESWTGRVDGPNPDHALWSTTVRPMDDPASVDPGVALIGFASDEGITRNYGRAGAADGPDAIRTSLGFMSVHDERPRYDAGTITVDGHDLEGAQDTLADAVSTIAKAGHLPVVLGGGHEAAWGSYRGLHEATGGDASSIAIINLDAHLDLRQAEPCNNGTPFRQVSELAGDDFNYSVLGVSPTDNTKFLFDSARERGVNITTDDQLSELSPTEAADLAVKVTDGRDRIHLSIDLDVLHAAVCPGVTSPASVGVPLANIRAICTALAETGRLALVDVVELSPPLDVDKRTARVASRLIEEITSAHRTS